MSVSSIASSSDVVVFSSGGCPYCSQAITNLKSAGYTPTVIEASSAQRAELLASNKSRSVPQIYVKGKYVGGCNDGPESWMGMYVLCVLSVSVYVNASHLLSAHLTLKHHPSLSTHYHTSLSPLYQASTRC
jgi:glutaredoxin